MNIIEDYNSDFHENQVYKKLKNKKDTDKKDDKRENKNVNGFVYFAYHPFLYDNKNIHHIKIGQTKNLERRLKQLQTGSSFKLMFYKTYQSTNYKEIEVELHKKYKDKQVLLEWFELTLKDVDKILYDLDPTKNTYKNTLIEIIKEKITNLFQKLFGK